MIGASSTPGAGHRQPFQHAGATRFRRRGYVLVMTLALLVLCATMLVTVSRASLRHAMAARSAADELQRKWGAVSCRRAVLENAERLLASAESQRKRPVAALAAAVRLGGAEFELLIADEQAKANVNALLAGADVPRAQTRIREALAGSGLANEVKLRPTYGPVAMPILDARRDGAAGSASSALTVSGFGQVFDDVAANRLVRRATGAGIAAGELLTCWGNGAVNARRAPEAALLLAAGRSLTRVEVNRLIEARDAVLQGRRIEVPVHGDEGAPPAAGQHLRALMQQSAAKSLKNRGNLGLVETSACHSLWVITRGKRRQWYDLAVLDRSNPDRPVTHTFSW